MSSPTFKLEDIVYRAGAGAGKTTTLVKYVIGSALEFRKEQGRFPRMVVTTYTRKATQELRERLLREGQDRENPELLQFLLSPRDLHISTIHGVLHLLLNRFGSRIGLDPGFGFLDQRDSIKRSKKILRSLVYGESKYEELLNLLGFDSITYYVRAIEKSYQLYPDLKPHNRDSLISTVEFFCANCSKELIDVAQDIKNETNKETWVKYSEHLESLSVALKDFFKNRDFIIKGFDGVRKPPNSSAKPTVSEELDERVRKVKDKVKSLDKEAFSLENIEIYSARYRDLHELSLQYSQLIETEKLHSGKIDIDDLELFSLKLLTQNQDIAEAFSNEWDYWLVDEFQDTSPLQVKLLRAMQGDRSRLLVGDPQQSIYFFRGARSEVFAQSEKEIMEKGGRRELLNRNYRSTPELLLFMNDLVQDFGSGFEPMQPRTEDAFDSEQRVAIIGKTNDEAEELNFISSKIQELIAKEVSLEKICVLAKKNKDLKIIAQHLNLVGVSTQIHAASGFFDRREILDLLCILKFLVNPHDNGNLVEVLRTPWFRMADQKIVEASQQKKQVGYKQSLWNFFLQEESLSFAVKTLKSGLDQSVTEGTIVAFEKLIVSSGLIHVSHYHDSTGQRESNIWKFLFRLKEESRKPGFHILNFIKNGQSTMSLEEYSGDSDASPAFEPNRVNLMTIHSAKGLQFEYVFIPFLDKERELPKRGQYQFIVEETQNRWCCELPMGEDLKGSSPLNTELYRDYLTEQESLESERLFYVALTRAKQRVYLSFTKSNSKHSWLSKLKWPFELGVYKTDYYSYVIEEGPWTVEPLKKSQQRAKVLKPLYECKLEPLKREQRVSVSQVLDFWESKSVSSLSTELTQLPARIEKALRGTLVHKLFESLHYNGFESGLSFIDSKLNENKNEIIEALSFIEKTKELPLKDLIEKGQVEWGFLMHYGRTTIEGQIDLWGRDNETIWIIDYKTGSPEHSTRARRQLELYALAVKKSGIEGRFKLAAIFPLSNTVLTFPEPNFVDLEESLRKL